MRIGSHTFRPEKSDYDFEIDIKLVRKDGRAICYRDGKEAFNVDASDFDELKLRWSLTVPQNGDYSAMSRACVEKMVKCEYFIECSDVQSLWAEYSIQCQNMYKKEIEKHHVEWEQISMGHGFEVGRLYFADGTSAPVVINVSFAILEGTWVCFYDTTSRFVDHKMVEDFLESRFPYCCDGRLCYTDAVNFHNAIHHIKRRSKEREVNTIEA